MNNDLNKNPQQSRLVFSADLKQNSNPPERQNLHLNESGQRPTESDVMAYTPFTQPFQPTQTPNPYGAVRKMPKKKKKDWVLRILAGVALAEVLTIGITILIIFA